MNKNPPHIASLWIGGALSFVEILSLKSMLAQGHEITLFSYQNIPNIPHGVSSADAREIYNPNALIVHERTKTPSPHADIFRLKLMKQTDFVWSDADMVYLKPLPSNEYIFAYESENSIGNSVLGLPQNSPALKAALSAFEEIEARFDFQMDENDFGTGLGSQKYTMHVATFGPHLLTPKLRESGEIEHALPIDSFYPIPINSVRLFFRKPAMINEKITNETIGVHLWAWRMKRKLLERIKDDPEAEFLQRSWLGQIAAKHGINSDDQNLLSLEEAFETRKNSSISGNDQS